MQVVLTPEILAGFFSTLLSLAVSYIPGVQEWYAPKTAKQKSGLMLLGILIIAVSMFGLSCANVLQGVACTQDGLVRLAKTVFVALIANQGTYSISAPRIPKPPVK